MTKRPLVVLAVVFCAGIACARQIRVPFLPVYLVASCVALPAVFSLRSKMVPGALIICLTFLSGMTLLLNHQSIPGCHISKYVRYAPDSLYRIKGTVVSEPEMANNRYRFILSAKTVGNRFTMYPCCGKILVYTRMRMGVEYGKEILVTGILYRPMGFTDPKRREYLRDKDIHYAMNVKGETRITVVRTDTRLLLKTAALRLKQGIKRVFLAYLSPGASCILNAMVLGEKKRVPAVIRDSMSKTGTVHILVVSGFHVGLVAFIVMVCLKLLRVPRSVRLYIAALLLLFYCLMTGASTPTVRATIMSLVCIFSYALKRETDIYNGCAAAAMCLLALEPRQLFDIGTQLSFTSVISILYFYPRIKRLLRLEKVKGALVRTAIDGCLVSASAWLGTLWITAYYFHLVTPVAIIANLIIVPLAALITLSGFCVLFTAFLAPPLAAVIAQSSEFFIALMVSLSAFLMHLPGAYLSFK